MLQSSQDLPARSRGPVFTRRIAAPIAFVLIALLAFLSFPLFSKPVKQTGGAKGLPVSARELAFLAQCTLSRVDTEWMFDKTPDENRGLIFGRRKIGTFLGGAQSVRYDLPFFTCVGELAGTNWRYLNEATDERGLPYGGIASSIADLSGLPLFAPRQRGQKFSESVNYYNPEIIRWARENMIPDPKASVFGMVTYQEIYDEVFARSARILQTTDAYLQKEDPASGKTRFATYLKKYQQADYESRKSMRGEFAAVYGDKYIGSRADPYEFYFSAGHAATFWMRRGMDGTDGEVRKLLAEVLRRYDPNWK